LRASHNPARSAMSAMLGQDSGSSAQGTEGARSCPIKRTDSEQPNGSRGVSLAASQWICEQCAGSLRQSAAAQDQAIVVPRDVFAMQSTNCAAQGRDLRSVWAACSCNQTARRQRTVRCSQQHPIVQQRAQRRAAVEVLLQCDKDAAACASLCPLHKHNEACMLQRTRCATLDHIRD
jgi:hypothetical protein